MNNWKTYLLVAACAAVGGCMKTRSISNSGYGENGGAGSHYFLPRNNGSNPGFVYRGELSEFDVLGINREDSVSEEEIRQAIANAQRVKLKPGSSILLIQSGAVYPDGPMMTELSKHFAVVPFSGVAVEKEQETVREMVRRGQTVRNAAIVTDPDKPVTIVPLSSSTTENKNSDPKTKWNASNYSKSLRLAAARGGNDAIVCYWGILESATKHLATKTVSWVPIVNWMVPDEQQHMRIRLKVAIIDVRSGSFWKLVGFQPGTFRGQESERDTASRSC